MIIPCDNPCRTCVPFIGGASSPSDPDYPFVNLSSEEADVDNFIGRRFVSPPGGGPPIGGGVYFAIGCIGWCVSSVSQEDADLCAARQQIDCLSTNWPDANPNNPPPPVPPLPPSPPVPFTPTSLQVFENTPQSCDFTCPDGSVFTFVVPAGTFSAFSQAVADTAAKSYACNQAVQQRICVGNLLPALTCSNSVYSGSVTASSANTPLTFEIIGTLPPGLSPAQNETTLFIQGVPTVPGDFAFTVVVSDADGRTMEKQITLTVFGIVNESPLPEATVDEPYTETIMTDGTVTGGVTFSIVSGELPEGLELNTGTGELSGTPTEEGTFNFTIRATNAAIFCDKAFELEVEEVPCPAFAQTITLSEFNSAGNNYYGNVGGANPRRIMSARQGGNAVVSSVDADTMTEVAVSAAFAAGSIIALCYVPTSNRVLVAEPNSGTITILNAETLASVGTIAVSGGAVGIFDMTYDSVNDRVYVIWQDNPAVDGGTLSSFVGTTLAASTSTSLSADVNDTPGRVAFCVGTNKLYVSMFNSTPDLRLQIYQGSSLLSFGSFALGDLQVATNANTPMACSEDKVWVQVTDINTGDGSLLIIDSTIDTLQFSYAYGALTPRGLCWVPGANQMFTKLDSNIVIYSVSDNTQACSFAANEVADGGLVADPDNDNVFVTGSGTSNMDVYSYPP